jgi:hypothetical protein|tara:strand:+ start:822 stop:1199 length:378 start_codon:yes stop_codon:yes gene_type:complete
MIKYLVIVLASLTSLPNQAEANEVWACLPFKSARGLGETKPFVLTGKRYEEYTASTANYGTGLSFEFIKGSIGYEVYIDNSSNTLLTEAYYLKLVETGSLEIRRFTWGSYADAYVSSTSCAKRLF